MFKVFSFGILSGWLLFVSRKSLKFPRSHGFYRFFAWEAILALILINSRAWFLDPLSILQIVSWSLLLMSIVELGLGVSQLRKAGRPSNQRTDRTLLLFEKTSILVTTGIYGYIRHPLYGSLLFLTWGALLKMIGWYSMCLSLAATALLIATAKADEAECVLFFGSSFEEYRRRTKMFVPLLF